MSILVILVPISVVLLGVAIWAFVWAVRRGQFEQLDSAAIDILADDDRPRATLAGTQAGDGEGSDGAGRSGGAGAGAGGDDGAATPPER